MPWPRSRCQAGAGGFPAFVCFRQCRACLEGAALDVGAIDSSGCPDSRDEQRLCILSALQRSRRKIPVRATLTRHSGPEMLAAMIPAPRVYVHAPVRANLTPGRQAVRTQVLDRITTAGFEPQEFMVSGIPAAWSWNFDRAAQVMDRCQGAVILALAKYQFDDDHALPSEYAHYEGALALSKALPTLIVTEAGTPDAGIAYHGGGEFIHRLRADDVQDGGRGDYLSSEQFTGMFDQWAGAVRERSRVFLGYCSAAQPTADALIKFLDKSLGVQALDWVTDFGTGGTIMEEASDAIRSCRAGLFLFTKDDPLEGEDTVAAPRDNVVLEAGFCIATRGSRRTVIIREHEAKMPVDLGGIIYLALKDRSDISSIQESLRRALEKNL